MENFKIGDMVRTNKGDKAILVDISEDRKNTLIFNLSKMRPVATEMKNIKEKINDPNYKVVVGKSVECSPENSNEDEIKDELIETLRDENSFLKKMITDVMDSVKKR